MRHPEFLKIVANVLSADLCLDKEYLDQHCGIQSSMNADRHIWLVTCVMATGVLVLSHSRLRCLHTISFNNISFNFLCEFSYFHYHGQEICPHTFISGGIWSTPKAVL